MTNTLMDTQPQHTCILYQQPSITPHMLILVKYYTWVTLNSEKKTAPILCYIKYDKYHYHNEGHKQTQQIGTGGKTICHLATLASSGGHKIAKLTSEFDFQHGVSY